MFHSPTGWDQTRPGCHYQQQAVSFHTCDKLFHTCVCLLLQDLVQSCLHGGGGDMGGHVLRETTSRGLCGLVCPSRTRTREEPGTLIQGAPVFPGSSRLGIEPKTPKVAGARSNHQADRGSDPNHRGIWSPPRAGVSHFVHVTRFFFS
jgi:hypothetical protein